MAAALADRGKGERNEGMVERRKIIKNKRRNWKGRKEQLNTQVGKEEIKQIEK
jgi:hypothetical protein